MNFRVVPIPQTLTAEARRELRSPQYGHPAHVEVASGYGPCRACLRTFDIGAEQRLLFTYNPFEELSSYPAPGPVFVHADECDHFAGAGFPETLRDLPIVLEGYDESRLVVQRIAPAAHEIEAAIEQILSDGQVRYIHVRNREAGCFIAQVDRLGA